MAEDHRLLGGAGARGNHCSRRRSRCGCVPYGRVRPRPLLGCVCTLCGPVPEARSEPMRHGGDTEFGNRKMVDAEGHERCGPSRDSSSKLQLGCAITTKRSCQIPNVWPSQAQPAGRASLTSIDSTARLSARGSHAHLERHPAAPGTSCRATPRPLSRRPRRSGKVLGHQDRHTPQRRNQNTGSHETD